MNVTLWVLQVLLAVVLAATGAIKFTQPRLSLQGRMAWVVDVSDAQVKGIGRSRECLGLSAWSRLGYKYAGVVRVLYLGAQATCPGTSGADQVVGANLDGVPVVDGNAFPSAAPIR